MPGCNGATVARMTFKVAPEIPLLVLTAFKDEEMESTLRRFGVKEILTKPIEPEALVQSVMRALPRQSL
jgi:DNA-binding NarL/FixJ family response regulator